MKMTGLKYLIIIVAGIALILLLFGQHIPFGKNNTDFAVKPGTDITGIDLIKGDKKVMIRRSGSEWIVNKTKEARKSAVLFLITTLREIKIKSPVSSEMFKSEVIDKKTEPVRVVVYDGRRPVRSFFVYPTASNLYGNIMKMRPTSRPFIIYLPGYEDNIGSHFIADELFWLPFSVFSFLPSRIESVEFQNFKEPSESFNIIRRSDSFMVSENSVVIKGFDSVRLKRYISYFTFVSFESWALSLSENERHDIESSTPLYKLSLKTRDVGEITLTIWERKKDPSKGEKDTDRVWAEKNDGKGIFVARYFDLDPILKKKSYFFGR
jgi:hypothetical protein